MDRPYTDTVTLVSPGRRGTWHDKPEPPEREIEYIEKDGSTAWTGIVCSLVPDHELVDEIEGVESCGQCGSYCDPVVEETYKRSGTKHHYCYYCVLDEPEQYLTNGLWSYRLLPDTGWPVIEALMKATWATPIEETA